jgi:hypothetical protein
MALISQNAETYALDCKDSVPLTCLPEGLESPQIHVQGSQFAREKFFCGGDTRFLASQGADFGQLRQQTDRQISICLASLQWYRSFIVLRVH